MKTFVLDVLTPEDEEMVLTILEGLRKGNAIQFQAVEPLPLHDDSLTDDEWADKLRQAEASGSVRLTKAEALARFGL